MDQVTGLQLDASRPDPLFRQVADQIVQRIESGAFPAGARLPPTRTLAEELGTHRNTVVRAYEVLGDNGWVESVVGRGTFVAARSSLPAKPQQAASTSGACLNWDGLLSSAGADEVLLRTDRLPSAQLKPGADLVNLASMQPGPEMLPARELRLCLDHVLSTLGPKALGYSPREGVLPLRKQIVSDLATRGVMVTPDDIIVTAGSQQAIDLVARALIDPGDAFAVDAETYTGTIGLLTVAGARLSPIPSDSEGPSMQALERFAGLSRAKGVYLMPNSRNPTGGLISADRRRELVAWSQRTGQPLIEDDYGADLVLDEETLPPALRTLHPDVLHISTFSKRLIPALRTGFVVCPPALRPRLIALKHSMDLGGSALLQYALSEFLDRGYLRAHLRRILPAYRERRDALEAALSKHMPADLCWSHLARGLVMWLELPPDVRSEDLFLEAQKAGVLIAPGSLHSVSGRDQHGVRITIARESPERIEEGVKRLKKAISRARRSGTRAPRISGI